MVFSMRIRRWAVLALCCWSAQAVHAQGLPQIKLEGVTSVDRAAADVRDLTASLIGHRLLESR